MPPKLQISAPLPARRFFPATSFQQFKSNPSRFIADRLYTHQPRIVATTPTTVSKQAEVNDGINLITLVCISDTHNTAPSDIPDGDVLLHAGDLTNKGSFGELQAQLDWINTLPHPHKIVIAGNHDSLLDEDFVKQHPYKLASGDIDRRNHLNWGSITYLEDTSRTITIRKRTLTIYGSPLAPQCGTFAFQYLPIRDVWKNLIPDGTDIILTHGPPKGHLDAGGKGCEWLLRELWRVKPRVVVFGHIHQGRGQEGVMWDSIQCAYDFQGIWKVMIMLMVLGWRWFGSVFGRKRRARTVLVNAAVMGSETAGEVVYV